ncbi:unnamed protein product [Alopecurus aequalis]
MDPTSKRCRIDAADRLSDLPDCLLHIIISSLGSRQAVQTSVLSRRWRHLWRDVPCAVVDEEEFVGDQWERFEDFADRLLTSIPAETRLDAFRLNLLSGGSVGYTCGFITSDRWIRRGLSRFPAVVDIRAAPGCSVRWRPHHSYSYASAQAPDPELDLSATGLCAAGFTQRLRTLRLVGVNLTGGFVEDFGRHCPAIEELHVERCLVGKLGAIASPTLRSLVIVESGRSLRCVHFRITAPRLACLRLEIPYNGENCYCGGPEATTEPKPLASLAEASIRLTDTSRLWERNQRARKKRKLEFLKSMRSFLALLPNVTKLHLTGFTTTALLEEESQEFPELHGLKYLLLEECDVGLKFQALTSILQNTTNLEKLGLRRCTFLARPAKKRQVMGRQQPSKGRSSMLPVSWCKNLESIEIEGRQEDAPRVPEVLLMVSKGMDLEQWGRVKKSVTFVPRTD